MTDGIEFCKTCFHKKDDHFFMGDAGENAYHSCGLQECECTNFVLGETRITSATGGSKGTKEERFDLVPVYPLTLLARLYAFGAKKYTAHNWRNGYEWSKSYAAAQRHLTAFWDGEDIDPETKVPHVINVAFHMFVLAQYMRDNREYDDRYKPAEVDRTKELGSDEFYQVREKEYASGWVSQGFYRNKEKAEAKVAFLRELHKNDDEYEVHFFIGGFLDHESV